MADVRKTVEIALQVIGVDLKKIEKISSAFVTVQKQVEQTTTFVGKLQKKLDNIKAPKSLQEVIVALQKIDKIKAPNLTNIANGFDRLGKMVKPPDLSPFVKELQKFSDIRLPNISTLINGFTKLTGIPIKPLISKIAALNGAIAALDKKGKISAFTNFARDVSKMKTAFSSAADSMNKMRTVMNKTGESANAAGLKLRTFGDKVRTVLQFRMISAAILGVNDAIRGGLNAIKSYDQALKDLQAITGATTLEVAQMGLKILEVASTTKFSAEEVAKGMTVIGQAGFSATEAIETMQAVSDLATGTLSNMDTAVDLVTTAMRVFQIDATESGTAADVFANAVNGSKLTIDKLRTSMNYVGPIARDAGVSFQELSASMGVLANSGLRASTIGTGLRRVFAELIDPSKKLREAAAQAGVALNELDPRSTSLTDVMSNLGLVLNDAQVAFDVFGKRGAAAALALANTKGGFNEMLDTINRSGTAANMASIQMEGLGVSFKNLQDKVGILAIAFGKLGITDAFRIIINVSRDLVDILTVLIDSTLARFIGKTTLLVGALVALKVAFSFIALTLLPAFGTALGVLVAKFAVVNTAIAGTALAVGGLQIALAPILLVIGGIAAAAAAAFWIFTDGAEEASREAAILAGEYDTLAKKTKDYGKNTVNLKEDSKELVEANKRLRTHLLEVADGMTDVADEAYAAAESIDPLTGKFTDGKVALKEYQAALDSFQTEALLEALEKAGDSLEIQTDRIHRLANRIKDAFGQIGIYANALKGTLYDAINLDVSDTPKRWIKAWKDATRRGEEIKEGLELSEALDKNEASMKDLADAVKSFDGRNLTAQQTQLKEKYDALNERAKAYVQHLRDTGKVNLEYTVESFKKLEQITELTGTELQSVILEFERLKKASEGTFDDIIEKWERDSDPKFLTSIVEGFNEVAEASGRAITEEEKNTLALLESQRTLRITQLNDLKQTAKDARASGEDTSEFWDKYYEDYQALLKQAGSDRKILSANSQAQQLIAFAKEQESLKQHLNSIRQEWGGHTEKLQFELAKARAESAARIDAIVKDVPDADTDAQTEAYKRNLKEREVWHAKHLSNIAQEEASKEITEEAAEKRKLNAELNFYAVSIAKAKAYRAQVIKESDPEEYEKRNNVVLAAQEKYYDKKAKITEDLEDNQDEIVNSRIERRLSISDALYEKSLKQQEAATKTLVSEIKLQYEKDLFNIAEYYDKRRKVVEEDTEKQKSLLETEIKNTEKYFDAKIAASNSEIEQKDLEAEKITEVMELKQELDEIDQTRIQTINSLTAAEIKGTEALQNKVDAVIKSIEKSRDAQLASDETVSFEDKQKAEMVALDARQTEEYDKLVSFGAKKEELERAIAAQAEERRSFERDQEKALVDYRIGLASDFAGNAAAAMKGLLDSGLIQSKKAFKAYQALAIAEAMINTYQSATGAYNAMVNIPYVGPALGAVAAAAAIAAGLAQVAQIRSQQPAYAEGGEILGASPHSKADNIDIKATAGEYMQPVAAVQKYGTRVMNAIRTLSIPKESLQNLISGGMGLNNPIPSFALATGGGVPSKPSNSATSPKTKEGATAPASKQPINFINVMDYREVGKWQATSEGVNSLLNVMSSNAPAFRRVLV